jgi:hypothetical protein
MSEIDEEPPEDWPPPDPDEVPDDDEYDYDVFAEAAEDYRRYGGPVIGSCWVCPRCDYLGGGDESTCPDCGWVRACPTPGDRGGGEGSQ